MDLRTGCSLLGQFEELKSLLVVASMNERSLSLRQSTVPSTVPWALKPSPDVRLSGCSDLIVVATIVATRTSCVAYGMDSK